MSKQHIESSQSELYLHLKHSLILADFCDGNADGSTSDDYLASIRGIEP
jgi:hypothetical protein